ncbi:putative alcohol-forming fatty acyl-CoA reductase [Medicago truncatula]|uniref:Fatty acyl-CoA reductase n=1 Tax=Medicago truncatula TaxID=3880 RepID=A0A396HYW9_MEDTR|nr:putative alcohol-forming fatty acyl-CoA reductase [Medicago truncatula]
MGEMLVVNQKDNVPLIIIRPTMITSTNKDPFPGWIEGVRTMDSVICGYGLGKLACFVGNANTVLDTVSVICLDLLSYFILLNTYFLELNMFLVLINIQTFRFIPSKIFLQLLVPIKFSITTFDLYF